MSLPAPHQEPSNSLVSTSPCHHMTTRLVNPIDQGITAETRVSRVDQDSVSAADCISVFAAGFFLVNNCLSHGQVSTELLMSPKRSVAPVPTTVARHRNHHKRRLTNVPVLAGFTRLKLQQSCCPACVPKPLPPLTQSSLQNPMVPTTSSEILAEEATRTIHADGGEDESETVTEHEDSH